MKMSEHELRLFLMSITNNYNVEMNALRLLAEECGITGETFATLTAEIQQDYAQRRLLPLSTVKTRLEQMREDFKNRNKPGNAPTTNAVQ